MLRNPEENTTAVLNLNKGKGWVPRQICLSLQTSRLCIVGNLAGGGSLAVAVAVAVAVCFIG